MRTKQYSRLKHSPPLMHRGRTSHLSPVSSSCQAPIVIRSHCKSDSGNPGQPRSLRSTFSHPSLPAFLPPCPPHNAPPLLLPYIVVPILPLFPPMRPRPRRPRLNNRCQSSCCNSDGQRQRSRANSRHHRFFTLPRDWTCFVSSSERAASEVTDSTVAAPKTAGSPSPTPLPRRLVPAFSSTRSPRF